MFHKTRLSILGLLLVLALLAGSAPAGAATDKLPDLAMGRLRGLQIENTADARRLLRFNTIIVNIGLGAFELAAQRSSTSTPWSARQVIFDDAGGSRGEPPPAPLLFRRGGA